MSDLIVAAIRIVFIACLWIFIYVIADIIRRDMFGKKVKASSLPQSLDPLPAGACAPSVFSVTQGEQQGMSVPVADTINLGRAADSTFILEDDYASSRHAQLVRQDPTSWLLTDLNSTNGTYVNGRRVEQPVLVSTGDVIRIGRTLMRLEE